MNFTGRHLLTLKDYSKEEILFLLDLSKKMKTDYKSNRLNKLLEGKSLGMIFQKRSTRTRISTEVGMTFLGGHALFLGKDDIQLGENESLRDSSLVFSRFVDGVLARVFGHEIVEEMAKYSSIPIINALSDKYHPLQILADLLTIKEHFNEFSGLQLAWIGDGNNVCHSLMIACAKLGINMVVATPEGYKPNDEIFSYSVEQSKLSECSLTWTSNPKDAARNADIIVTDTFISMGQEIEKKQKLIDFHGFQVNSELVTLAKPNYKFMHCLPRKKEEVTDDVFYSDHSIVFDEAENRLYTVMAVLLATMENTDRN